MPGAPDPLQEGRDVAGGPELAHEVDVADVDAELERGGGDEEGEGAALQALLRLEPAFAREAAVVGGHLPLAEPLGEGAGGPLHEAPGVGEDEGGAMLAGECGDAVVDLFPDLGRHHRFERRRRQLDGEVAPAVEAFVDDRAGRFLPAPDEEARDERHRALGWRRARSGAGGGGRPRAASAAALPDDTPASPAQSASSRSRVSARCAPRLSPATAWISSTMTVRVRASAFRPDSLVSRMWSDSGVVTRMWAACGPSPGGPRPGCRRCAPSPGSRPAAGRAARPTPRPPEGRLEVPLDVVGERLERRHVDDPDRVVEQPLPGLLGELVDDREERRKGLAGAGGGGDEGVAPAPDLGPRLRLTGGGSGELGLEPGADGRVAERAKRHRRTLHHGSRPVQPAARAEACAL